MGEGITGPPNQYPAGLDFDYSVWTAGTRVNLVNVPWNNDYRDVVKFASRNDLNTYIDGLQSAGISIPNMTYAKPGEDIYLGIPYNRVNRYNYLRASNPLMPIPGDIQKDFYYFILECEYVNPSTTRIRVQLDVWQTYVYDVTFGNCYVERGHIGIANENAFDNYGRDYLTVPEGLDVGSEYQQIARRSEVLIMNNIVASGDSIDGDIIVVTTVDVEQSGGTPQAPILKTARGSQVNGMPSGADFYVFKSVASFTTWLQGLSDKPWVSQGIISVSYMPSTSRYSKGFEPEDGERVIQLVTFPIKHSMFTDWRNNPGMLQNIPSRYRHLKKFFTFPYMAIELTTWVGNPIILKPEAWNDANASVLERASYMPPNQRVEFIPRRYNARSENEIDNLWDMTDSEVNAFPEPVRSGLSETGDDGGEYLDLSVRVANFPSLPVVNNMAIGYLAANANQIAYQFQSADWSQQRAIAGAQAGYDIASGAMRAAMSLSGIGVNADIAQTANTNRTLAAQAAVNAISQGVGGIGMALTPGGFGGAAIAGVANGAATGINAGIQTAANDEALAVRNSQAAQTVQTQNRQAQLSRDTNFDLANFAARGDYANQVAGINAKVRDAALTQPSVSGQFAGESHNIGANKLEMSIRWKLIDNASIRVIGEIWLRYGYAVRAFIQLPQTLMVMSKFTYWKLTETYIASSTVPEGHKQVIRGVLEKGVTVWKDPSDIGQIDIADNTPLSGVSY